MRQLAKIFFFICILSLSACASYQLPVTAGETEAQTVATLGQPKAVYADGSDKLLFYQRGYWDPYAYMARIGPNGIVKSYEQVWSMAKFAQIQPNVSTKDDVLRIVGIPTELTQYPRTPNYIVWNYGFSEPGAWNSMMSIYIDDHGIVRRMENGQDKRYAPTGGG